MAVCEANINGFKIHTVYIMGDQYNGVVWAYEHIGEETCLTPTNDINSKKCPRLILQR